MPQKSPSHRVPATGKEGQIVGGLYDGPVPTAGVALAYAISYTVPERSADFLALEVELQRRRPSP